MELIQKLKGRKANNGREYMVEYGVYRCGYCNSEVELPAYIGGHRGHCGCQGSCAKNISIWCDMPVETRSAASLKAERRCLMCGKNFVSRGPQNRRCGLCEIKLSGDGQAYYMPPVHGVHDRSTVACCWET